MAGPRRAVVVVVSIVALLAGSLSVLAGATSAQALDGSQFDAGNIISDSNFYAPSAMSQADIQSFLDAKIGTCANSNCLNIVRTTSTSRAADLMCGAYQGASAELTSAIIYKVQQACGISAKVILVTLQKEQGLVSGASARAPSAAKLERAMGYACPDSANGACDPTYAGLYNQIYRAAWQFKRYSNPPGTSNTFTWFPVGATTQILYSPSADCVRDTKAVTIQNRATAALYYYTPYTPDAAALANLTGTGDTCSSYGNRNFWVYYNTWFGPSTAPPGTPDGQWDSPTTTAGKIYLNGWTFDRDAPTTALTLDIQVGSSWYTATANGSSPSVATDYPGAGPDHGFSVALPATGAPTVCIYVRNIGPGVEASLGCRTVQVADGSPVGNFAAATPGPNSVTVSGWALDTDQLSTPVVMDVQVGPYWFTATADQAGWTAAGSYPGVPGDHAFSTTFTVAPGVYTVCIYPRNTGAGAQTSLGCIGGVTVNSQTPVGALQTVQAVPGGVSVSGWALDPDTPTTPIVVDLQVGSTWYIPTADQPSPAAAAAYPTAGTAHGFAGTYQTAGGPVTVCAYPRNSGVGPAVNLGCQTVTVAATGAAPRGQVTSLTTSPNTVSVAGWALDDDALTSPVTLDVQLNSTWSVVVADQPSDATAQISGAGTNHGFSMKLPAPTGTNTLCIYLRNLGAGPGAGTLGCSTVTVPAGGPPVGAVTTATANAAGLTLAGWAVDPDIASSPMNVSIQVNSSWYSWRADQSSPGSTTVAGAGTSHGFSGQIPEAAGTYTVCIYLPNTGIGYDISLGCRVLTVKNAPPVGAVDAVMGASTGVLISGWVVDPDSLSTPVTVDVQAAGRWFTVLADQANSVAPQRVAGAGGDHGFSALVPSGAGLQVVCIYPRDTTSGSSSLGCTTVRADASPAGVVTDVTPSSRSVHLGGWVVDPDALTQAVILDVQIGSTWAVVTADSTSDAAAATFSGAGTSHGFDATLPSPSGSTTICIYARNTGGGGTSSLGCRPVVVP